MDEAKGIVGQVIESLTGMINDNNLGEADDLFSESAEVRIGANAWKGRAAVKAWLYQLKYVFPSLTVSFENPALASASPRGSVLALGHRVSAVSQNGGFLSLDAPKKLDIEAVARYTLYSGRLQKATIFFESLGAAAQLGLSPPQARAVVGLAFPPSPSGELTLTAALDGGGRGPGAADPTGGYFSQIYGQRNFSAYDAHYAPDCVFQFDGGVTRVGRAGFQELYISLFSSFPNAELLVEDCLDNSSAACGSAARYIFWRGRGLHEGFGYLGAPSGAVLDIRGATRQIFKGGLIQQERIFINSFDMLHQRRPW